MIDLQTKAEAFKFKTPDLNGVGLENGRIYNNGYNGYITIEVLEFLKGRELDQISLAYISALNPHCVRVAKGGTTLESIMGRITVFLDENDKIRLIQKEVTVPLPTGIENGHELYMALKKRQTIKTQS